MNCLVIGAGNAGRPAARILNYVGHQVQIIDQKNLEELPERAQEILLEMEKEGVELNLGPNAAPEMENLDSAYISPTIPEDSPIRADLALNNVKMIAHEEISHIVDELIDIDMIGVTGTLGKTSTTHIIAQLFEAAGYRVWKCSSRHGNLLSEVIIDGIIKGYPHENDIAVFELPHGTSRLMSEVNLKIGVLTNIYPEHLDEFENSLEKYAERKLFIANSSEILISSPQCKEYLEPLRDDVVFYCPVNRENQLNSSCDVSGYLRKDKIYINYDLASDKSNHDSRTFETDFKLKGYYFENSIAAAAVALAYGLQVEDIKKGLTQFKGISGHLEYMGNYCGREVHFDAAFVPQGLHATLKEFSKGEGFSKGEESAKSKSKLLAKSKLVVLIDNPDTTTIRDKAEIGNIVGEYADLIISSGYNETKSGVNMDAANEVLNGVVNPECLKMPVEDMVTAGIRAIQNSAPGDVILHVGPGAITNYDDLKQKMMSGIEEGCKRYG